MFVVILVLALTGTVLTATDTFESHKKLPVEVKELYNPPLQEIADVLRKGLREHFSEVNVDVVDCPNLMEPPFTLANVGLNGKTRLVSTGDAEYGLRGVNHLKVYDLHDYLPILGLNKAFIIGAHLGPREYVGVYCEGVCNINFGEDEVVQLTRVVSVINDTSYQTRMLPQNETRFNTQGDHFVSQGEPGPVLRIHVRKRIGQDSFSVSIRKVLEKQYESKIIGLGGVFLLKEGKALHIVAPDFKHKKKPDGSWLRYYNMSAPLVSVGLVVTGAYDLALHRQHFHSFSYHEDGGHYVIDTTPEEVEYLAYLNLAEYVYRIDRPPMRTVSIFADTKSNFSIF